MDTNEITTAYGTIIGKAASDAGFRSQLASDPKGALKAIGYNFPDSVTVKVVESTPNELTLALPPMSPKGKLSDAQLDQVSGGKMYESTGRGNDYNPNAGIWG